MGSKGEGIPVLRLGTEILVASLDARAPHSTLPMNKRLWRRQPSSVPRPCDFLLSHGWESTNSKGLWLPTHFAKNAKWMGHGALVRLRVCSCLFFQLHEIMRVALAKARHSGLLCFHASMSLTPSW